MTRTFIEAWTNTTDNHREHVAQPEILTCFCCAIKYALGMMAERRHIIEGYDRQVRELRAVLDSEARAIADAIGSVRFMDQPDGGSVSLAEQVRRMRGALEAAEAALCRDRVATGMAQSITNDVLDQHATDLQRLSEALCLGPCGTVEQMIGGAKGLQQRIVDEIATRKQEAANYEAFVNELVARHEASESVIHMAVARLGGEVEGQPTHRGNFLQRIDELRAIEQAAR